MSRRSGEELEFAKKGILYLLETEICNLQATKLLQNLSKVEGAFKLNSQTKHSVLHLLCARGEVEVVTKLLNTEIDFNIKDIDGVNPAFLALKNGHLDLCKKLASKNFKPAAPVKLVMSLFDK